jgi:4-hydroxybenzoate polyprenyltransferase
VSAWRDWLELARIANLPTVASNAVAGAAIGGAIGEVCPTGACWTHAPASALAALAVPPFAYAAGMILNDAFDASIDARERPTRPIPSGRIARSAAFVAGFTLLGGALAAALATGSAATLVLTAVLAASVILYDAAHARSAASVALLALCRALAALIPLVALALPADADGAAFRTLAADPRVWVLPATLAAWTLLLSIVARGEVERMQATPAADATRASTRERAVRAATFLAPLVVLVVAVGFFREEGAAADGAAPLPLGAWIALGAAIAAGWLAQSGWRSIRRNPAHTPSVIGTWIACLALLDAVVVGAAGVGGWAIACIAFAFLTIDLQRSAAAS